MTKSSASVSCDRDVGLLKLTARARSELARRIQIDHAEENLPNDG